MLGQVYTYIYSKKTGRYLENADKNTGLSAVLPTSEQFGNTNLP